MLAYNGTPHAALGYLTPVSVFLGTEFNFKAPIVDDRLPVNEFVREMAHEMSKVRAYLDTHTTEYLKRMENRHSLKSGVTDKPRKFKINDLVTRFRTSGSRTKDKLIGTKEGPFKVIGFGNTRVDFIVQRCGNTSRQPIHVHLDDLSEFTGKELAQSSDILAPAALGSKKYDVEHIIGQRKGVLGMEYLVVWLDYDGDPTWEPEANLSLKGKKEKPLNKFTRRRLLKTPRIVPFVP